MQNPDQVSAYFLYDLDKFRVFCELSQRHWEEELSRYNTVALEIDESTYWERYQYRNDLSADFREGFPQYQKQSFLLMLVSIFEDYLNQLCNSSYVERALSCSLKDYCGTGIERAKKYLKKVADIDVPTDTADWNKVIEARDIRNIIAHNAGHIDKEAHQKQLRIVAKNSNLTYQKFARIHLDVTQEYLFEVIKAMKNTACEIRRMTPRKT